MKPLAYNITRKEMHYRHEVFTEGLRAAGYDVREGPPRKASPGDVLLMWNRHGTYHDMGTLFEMSGGTVVVAENGYVGRDEHGGQLYALAKHGHNGSGSWNVGLEDRWTPLGIELQPWRERGDNLVLRGQRGIGSPMAASPAGWMASTALALRRMGTKHNIKMIPHPGNGAENNKDHETYLKDAHALIIWSSSVGVKALVMGVPVFYCSPYWVAAAGGCNDLSRIETPLMDDAARLRALQHVAWAQWRLSEIQSGVAFTALLGDV